MKVVIQLNEENINPYYAVFSEDNGSIKHLEIFTFRVGEPATSLNNQQANYGRALAYAQKLERKLTIVYEKEI